MRLSGGVNGLRGDVEWLEQPGELLLGEWLAACPFCPRPLRVRHQGGHQVRGFHLVPVAKGGADVGEQPDVHRGIIVLPR